MAKKEQQFVADIANINDNFPQWYTDVVLKTELCDYGPVKGSMVIRPYGYGIWENIQREMDSRIKATGHVNAYFPMMIPYSFLTREKEHVEGFAPEVALVTHYGEEELAEKLVVRPTSETIICEMYRRWIKSYRDLPVMMNQWANVFRCEKTTRPFLRTSEFLWQEGHTVHRTQEEAEAETLTMLNVYAEFMKNVLAIPVIIGKKSAKEKFAGAVATYGMEAMMLDGKSLQAGTSHYLGTNFAEGFDIKFLDSDGQLKHPYQTSWGVSTRLIGATIMAHGDERGLALPPRVAPIQAIIVPIAAYKGGVNEACDELRARLAKSGIRVNMDDSDNSPGWKFNQWEMKGVPLRIELGPRDIEAGVAQVFRRDTLVKEPVSLISIEQTIATLLDEVHENMYAKANNFLTTHIVNASTMESMEDALNNRNFVKAMWCGCPTCEAKVKTDMSATTRVMPFDQTPIDNKCIVCGKEEDLKVIYFARAY